MSAQWAVVAVAGSALAHRVDLEAPASAYCSVRVAGVEVIAGRLPAGVAQCLSCLHLVSRRRREIDARRQKLAAQRRAREAVARLTQSMVGMMSPAEANAADQDERKRARGTSVRAMTAGLPGLGRGR